MFTSLSFISQTTLSKNKLKNGKPDKEVELVPTVYNKKVMFFFTYLQTKLPKKNIYNIYKNMNILCSFIYKEKFPKSKMEIIGLSLLYKDSRQNHTKKTPHKEKITPYMTKKN